MFINVVQKAQVLFRDYAPVGNAATAKQLALTNPLFSWHATYATVSRKKIVLFTHDASTLVVALDVNAKNRSRMQERFWEALNVVWQANGLSATSLAQYRRAAGEWQINRTVSRSQIARLNDITVSLPAYSEWGRDLADLSPAFSQRMRQLPNGGEFITEKDLPKIMAPKNYQWRAVHQAVDPVDWQKVTAVVTELKALQAQHSDFERNVTSLEIDQAVQKITELNMDLIKAFLLSVMREYSETTLKTYAKELNFYLNSYLANRLETIFGDEAGVIGALLERGISEAEGKRIRTALRRLYHFLASKDLVDADFLQETKMIMRDTFDQEIAELATFPDETAADAQHGFPIFYDEQTDALIGQYLMAMAHLYGAITSGQAYRIICRQNPQLKLTPQPFERFLMAHRKTPTDAYTIDWFNEEQNNGDLKRTEVIVATELKLRQRQIFWQLLDEQYGKLTYVPKRAVLLRYQEAGYFEPTPETAALMRLFQQSLSADRSRQLVAHVVAHYHNTLSLKGGAHDLQNLLTELQRRGFVNADQAALEQTLTILVAVGNHTRRITNRGWTPLEIRQKPDWLTLLGQPATLNKALRKLIDEGSLDPVEFEQVIGQLTEISPIEKSRVIAALHRMAYPRLSDESGGRQG